MSLALSAPPDFLPTLPAQQLKPQKHTRTPTARSTNTTNKMAFSSGMVKLSLSTILPCLALSAALELALKNMAPTRPEAWHDLVSREIIVTWWPQKMFPNEDGLLNASSALALITTFIISVFAIYASKKGAPGVRDTTSRNAHPRRPPRAPPPPLNNALLVQVFLTDPIPQNRQPKSASPSSSSSA